MMEETKRTRTPNKRLRVTFPDGKSICHSSATATMIAVLNEIGADKFPLIELEMCHLPLLSQEVYPRYKQWMKPVCEGWWINLQSDSDTKYMQLRAISDQLGLGLSVEMGDNLEVDDTLMQKEKQKHKRKEKLLVRFPDGKCVAGNSPIETFLQTIWRLGIDELMRKNIVWNGIDLISTTHKVRNQVQVDDRLWVVVPNSTKDKVKLLRIISAMMHVNLETTVV